MPLLYEKRGAVAVLTLSRPQARNAWGEDYNAALQELLPQLEDDRDIRCVVLTGGPSAKPVVLIRPDTAWIVRSIARLSRSGPDSP